MAQYDPDAVPAASQISTGDAADGSDGCASSGVDEKSDGTAVMSCVVSSHSHLWPGFSLVCGCIL